MIPLSFWLTNVQFIISALATFGFFTAAWLNVDAWVIRKETKTGSRALGFFLLAIWSALRGIGIETEVMNTVTAGAASLGLITITISYLADKVPLPPQVTASTSREEVQKKPSQLP